MKTINKQKFLAELGKLLTFMCEEDRKTALKMYSELFDKASDEEALAKSLSSPTRQAVVIARTYDAKERKQQMEEGLNPDEEEPEFIEAIRRAIDDAGAQRFLLSEEEAARPKAVEQETAEYPEFTVPAEPVETEAPEESAKEKTPVDEMDVFLADLRINDLNEETEDPDGAVSIESEYSEEDDELLFDDSEIFPEGETKLKANPGMLAIFLVFAIPLGLVAIAAMLAFAVLFLGLAVGVGFLGFYALMAAFNSGLDIIADVLIVLGIAVVLFALAVLFLWTAVWFCAGAIPGIIRGIRNLAEKWCCKEVPA